MADYSIDDLGGLPPGENPAESIAEVFIHGERAMDRAAELVEFASTLRKDQNPPKIVYRVISAAMYECDDETWERIMRTVKEQYR